MLAMFEFNKYFLWGL